MLTILIFSILIGDHRSKDVNTSLSSIMSTSESSSIGIKSPSYMESSREEEAIHNAVSKKNASTFGNKRSKLAAIVSSAISSVNETLIDTTDVADSTTFSIKPAASKIVAASVEIVKPRLTRKSIQTPTITKASRVSARRNSVAPISKTAVEVEQKIPEEIESAVGRKRRQSFLPTTRGKKVFTGHVEKALLIDEGIVLEKDSMPVLKQAITPVKEASNPFADVLRSEKKQKMVESDKIILSVEESAETNALYSFEVGSDQKEKVIPTRIRRQRVSITRSSDAGGRRKSMAAVTAMLDSLNVKHSSTVDAIPGSVESNNDQDDLDNTNNDNPDDDEENTSVFSTVRVTRSMRSSSSAHLLDGLPAKQLTKKRKSQIVIEPIEENENADCNTSKTTKTCKVSKKKTVVADGNHNLKERKNIYVEETENYQHKWIDI